jgi:putative Mg2+ transporter-C (MgtC) family protein
VSWRRAITIGAFTETPVCKTKNKEPPMTLQALVHLNVATLVDSFISLASAFALGSLIGFERQVRQRTAGLRTNALVAVAASAFVDMAAQIGTASDTTRVIAYVVSGVGFLGAGTIMKEGLNVRGLNTAATRWVPRRGRTWWARPS